MRDEEYSDSEDEGDSRKDYKSYKEPSQKKRIRLTKEHNDNKSTPSPAPPQIKDKITPTREGVASNTSLPVADDNPTNNDNTPAPPPPTILSDMEQCNQATEATPTEEAEPMEQ
jgi:hypothetical protein